MHTVTGPGIDGIVCRDGEGAALSRAITAAEEGRLPDASYYVRDRDDVVRARVDRVRGRTFILSGLDLERGVGEGGVPLRSAVSSSRRPGSARDGENPTKEEQEVPQQKTTARKRSSAKRSSAPARRPTASATAEKVAADTEAGNDLYKALLGQVRETVKGVQEKPNKSETYTRLLTKGGKAFAYIFPPRKGGVALKIPKQLLGVERELPEGHGFKKTGWGLTRTVRHAEEAPVVAKALAVAALAVEK